MTDPTVSLLRASLRLRSRRITRAVAMLAGAFAFGFLAAAWWAL